MSSSNNGQSDKTSSEVSSKRPIVDAARLEALAEFSAGAGHEINNPLATIIGRVQMLLADEENLARKQALHTIGAQALRVRDMMSDVMLFARPPKPSFEPVNVLPLCEQAIQQLEDEATRFKVSLELVTKEISNETKIGADETQFLVMLTELLRNAIIASPENGLVKLTFEHDETMLILKVEDQGQGFSETEAIHLFDPFFSGRQAGRGLGFGLSKAWRIITNHHGSIDVETDNSNETTFVVHWPLANNI